MKSQGSPLEAGVSLKADGNETVAAASTAEDYPDTQVCRQKFPMFQSPVAITSNRLLWGDWDKGEYGLLARSVDVYDRSTEGLKGVYDFFEFEAVPVLEYLPAVYLHASLRTSKAIFEENPENSFAVLIGTKYAKNTAFKAIQENGSVVDCENYYPGDAGTIARGVLEQPGGTFCRPERVAAACVDGTCLATDESACGECTISGAKFGDLVARFAEAHEPMGGVTFINCWYNKSREGMTELVAAANSLWMERKRWRDNDDFSYGGWTECPATKNIQQKELMDAIAIPLYHMDGFDPSACDFVNQEEIVQRLQLAHDRGFGLLPVVFYRETVGMKEASDCERVWGGKDCDNGREKRFFSQEYTFENGACLHRPLDLKEVYYFPPEDVTNSESGCSAFGKRAAKRIKRLKKCETGIKCDWDISKEAAASLDEVVEITEEERCNKNFPMLETPVSQRTNRLLWGDWEKGEFGLLARSIDVYDRSRKDLKEVYKVFELDFDEIPDLEYLPASYLHASLRAPMGIFVESETNGVSVIVGTKYAKNTAFKDMQENGAVDCENYYPGDAGTISRGVLEQPGATFCRVDRTNALCIDGTCLTADSESACGQCTIAGADFGDHVARWSEQHNEKLGGMTASSCWYDKSREGMTEMVAASNSLWLERPRWNTGADLDYGGWTECPATKNIKQKQLLDAIAIPLTRGAGFNLTMCNWSVQHDVFERLQLAYDKGFGLLPVLFYQEVLGMDEEDCTKVWGGTACDNGRKRGFFAQEYVFDNGACIHRPPGCNETYYFPPNDIENPDSMCSAFSEDSFDRVERLRRCETGIECEWDEPKEVSEVESIEDNDSNRGPELENSKVEECQREFPVLESPVAHTTNRLLWGDWDKGEYGVLIRSFLPGLFDGNQEFLKQIYTDLGFDEVPKLHYLPASYLHASMRAARGIFVDESDDGNMFSLLVGTKYKKNWAMKQFQREGSVDCQIYYPTDGHILWQGSLEKPDATFCRPSASAPLCVNDTCLANSESACGGCTIAGQLFGDLVARQSEQDNIKHGGLTFMSCWYSKARAGMQNMVAAANSAWTERRRWRAGEDNDYPGWTECPATLNINEKAMVDAVVIPLYIPQNPIPSMCNYDNQDQIGQRLQLAYDNGYGHLPVLFYIETQGSIRLSDCQRFWGGTTCNDGYQKEFFSQEFKFRSGACVHRPSGCKEAYYFPALDAGDPGVGCSAFSDNSIRRIESLVLAEVKMAASIISGNKTGKMQLRKNLNQGNGALLTIPNNLGWMCFIALGLMFFLFVRRTKHQERVGLKGRPNGLAL